MATKPKEKPESAVVIQPVNIVRTTVRIRGTAPLVQHRFWKKLEVQENMTKTAAEKKAEKNQKKPRDYEQEWQDATHRSIDGHYGVPASGIRTALIDACRTVKLPMTTSRMAVFVIADTLCRDGTPLVRIYGTPERFDAAVRNDDKSVDIRARPMWHEWYADVTLEFDADMITPTSVINLLDRAGRQVGIGEGRPFSKTSCGQGWGTFRVESAQ